MPIISPSLPATSFGEIQTLIGKLEGVITLFQVDIVDGVFVPPVSWPFTENDPVLALKDLRLLGATVAIEVDCMVDRPEQYVKTLLEAAVVSVIVHWGSTAEYEGIADMVHAHGAQLGLAITNDTPLEAVYVLLPNFDFIQVMGIKTVGAQGQPFDERTPETVATLRSSFPTLPIVIDGAVNSDTIARLKAAGATRFAPGSAIAKANDPRAAYEQLDVLACS